MGKDIRQSPDRPVKSVMVTQGVKGLTHLAFKASASPFDTFA